MDKMAVVIQTLAQAEERGKQWVSTTDSSTERVASLRGAVTMTPQRRRSNEQRYRRHKQRTEHPPVNPHSVYK